MCVGSSSFVFFHSWILHASTRLKKRSKKNEINGYTLLVCVHLDWRLICLIEPLFHLLLFFVYFFFIFIETQIVVYILYIHTDVSYKASNLKQIQQEKNKTNQLIMTLMKHSIHQLCHIEFFLHFFFDETY